MSKLKQEILAANAQYAAAFGDKAKLALPPAHVYNAGRSEEVVGDTLKKNGQRHHIVLGTKVHGNMHPGDALDPNQGPAR